MQESPVQYPNIIYHYTNSNGLKQESIPYAMFDADNFLWLATNSGIERFDGKKFTSFHFKNNARFREFYKSNVSDSLFVEDEYGNLYIIKEGRLVTQEYMKIGTNCINSYRRNILFLSKEMQTAIFRSPESEIRNAFKNNSDLFLTGSNGVYYFNHTDTNAYYIINKQTIRFPSVRSMGDFSFLLKDTLYILDRKKQFHRYYEGRELAIEKESHDSIANEMARFFLANIKGNAFLKFIYTDNKRLYFILHNNVYRLTHTRDGFVTTKTLENIPAIPEMSSLVYHYASGGFFISSNIDGLYYIKKKTFTTIRFPQSSAKLVGNENNNSAIIALGKDSILSGTGIIYTATGSSRLNYPFKLLPYVLFTDSKGNIYYCGGKSGRYSPNIPAIINIYKTRYITQKGKIVLSNITDGTFGSFNSGCDGSIYYNTVHTIYRLDGDSFRAIIQIPKKIKEGISRIHLIKNGDIIIGTSGKVLLYHTKNGTYDTLLNNILVRSIYEDHNNNIWIGTYGMGFYIITKAKEVHSIPVDKDQNLLFTHNFLEDANGFMWSGTNNGLYRYSISDIYSYLEDSSHIIHYSRFDIYDGIATNEFNGGGIPTAVRTPDSSVLFASINGIVKFRPEAIAIPDNNSPIWIDKISLDNQPVQTGTAPLLVAPSVNAISFLVATSSIGRENNYPMEYRIEELSSKWIPVNYDGEITLNKLVYGQYTLVLRKEINANSFLTKSIPFTVKARFYQTWYFYVLLIVLFSVSIALFYRYRLNKVTLVKKMLEKIVKEKTISLEESLTEVSESRKELIKSYSTIEKVTRLVLHDLISPLRFLSEIADNLSKNKSQISEARFDETITMFSETCNSVYTFTNTLLEWLMNNSKELVVTKQNTDIRNIFYEIAAIYTPTFQITNNTLTIDLEENLYAYTNKEILSIIIRNVLDNSNKNTKNGLIQLIGYKSDDCIIISVIDNGKGFDTGAMLNKIEDDNALSSNTLGMRIIHELSKKIGATYSFQSSVGRGTKFSLKIPLLSI